MTIIMSKYISPSNYKLKNRCRNFALKTTVLIGILIILSSIFSSESWAQNHINKDSIQQAKKLHRLQRKQNRQKLNFSIDAIRFGLEGTYLFQGLLSKNMADFYSNIRKYEGSFDVTFLDNSWCLIGDFGRWESQRIANVPFNGYQYQNHGYYFRLGLDYNILKHMKQKFTQDAIFLGMRFGQATGNHTIRLLVTNIPWKFYDIRDENGDLTDLRQIRYDTELPSRNFTANWFELVTGLRATIWKNFQMGYTFRYKILASVQNQHENLAVNEIPGFGTTEITAKPSFSYHIFYRLPLRKSPKDAVKKLSKKSTENKSE